MGTPGVESKLDGIAKEVGEIRVLIAGMMPRAEVDGELARRVSLEAYTSDRQSLLDRVTKLEASPMKLLAWISVGSGCLSLLIAAIVALAGILEFALTHH